MSHNIFDANNITLYIITFQYFHFQYIYNTYKWIYQYTIIQPSIHENNTTCFVYVFNVKSFTLHWSGRMNNSPWDLHDQIAKNNS